MVQYFSLFVISLFLLLPPIVLSVSEMHGTDPQAEKVIKRVSEFYKDLEAFSVEITSVMHMKRHNMDSQMQTVRTLKVNRPEMASLEIVEGLGGSELYYDGKTLTRYYPFINMYTIDTAAKSLEMLKSLDEKVGVTSTFSSPISLFIDFLFRNDPLANFLIYSEQVEYVEKDQIADHFCHHLHFAYPQFDFDMWIETGEKPFIRKVQPDLAKVILANQISQSKAAEFELDIEIVYDNWEIEPAFSVEEFQFKPTKGSQQVDNIMQAIEESMQPQVHSSLSSPLDWLAKPLPPIELLTWDGDTISIPDKEVERIILVVFLRSDDPTADDLINGVELLIDQYKENLEVLFVISEDEKSDFESKYLQLKQNDITHICWCIDSEGQVMSRLNIQAKNQMMIVDKKGIVQSVHVAWHERSANRLRKEIQALFEGRALIEERFATNYNLKLNSNLQTMKRVQSALEAFFIDHNSYPIPKSGRRLNHASIVSKRNDKQYTLTEPLEYLKAYPTDPYDVKERPFRYASNGKTWYMFVSNGPDGIADFDERQFDGTGDIDLGKYQYNPNTNMGDIIIAGP